MSKKGIIVVSWPRTGSSEFMRRIGRWVLNQNLNKDLPIAKLAEFFHWADTTTHGNLLLSREWYRNEHTNKQPFNDKFLEINLSPSPVDFKKTKFVEPNHFLNQVEKTFDSISDTQDYYLQQYMQRIGYTNDYITKEYFPIIKSFPGFLTFLNTRGKSNDEETGISLMHLQTTLVAKLTNIEPIFYYKKNLVACILSDLIKWHYIVKPNIENKIPVKGITGHNFDNSMEPLEPKKGIVIDIDNWQMTKVICNTLKIYQQNKKCFKNKITFDQAFVDNKVQITFGDVEYNVEGFADHTVENSGIGFPMNYTAPRKDYFENSNEIVEMLKRDIDDYGLGDLVDELGLVLDE